MKKPNDFWKTPEHRHQSMTELGKTLGYKAAEDWYRISANDFRENDRGGLLHYYNNSPSAAVMDCFPEYVWKEWLFDKAPQGWWDTMECRRHYMVDLANLLCFKKPEDFYRLTLDDFYENKGSRLLRYYQTSPSAVVIDCFPEYEWKEWLFGKAPHIWAKPEKSHRYFVYIGKQYGMKKPEDWYQITHQDFSENKGISFLKLYNGSPIAAVKAHLPQYEWIDWFFDNVPLTFWQSQDRRRRFMEWLGKKLGIRRMEDWYNITGRDFRLNRGGTLLGFYGSPARAVIDCFPEYDWHEEEFSHRKKRQKQLYAIIKRIFSAYEVIWEYRPFSMIFSKTKAPMTFDIGIPSLNLVFEYQGELHSKNVYGEKPLQETQARDKEKQDACARYGMTLIEVHYRWDGREDSVIEHIADELQQKITVGEQGTDQLALALAAIHAYTHQKPRQ